jgi:hypothetical protein
VVSPSPFLNNTNCNALEGGPLDEPKRALDAEARGDPQRRPQREKVHPAEELHAARAGRARDGRDGAVAAHADDEQRGGQQKRGRVRGGAAAAVFVFFVLWRAGGLGVRRKRAMYVCA